MSGFGSGVDGSITYFPVISPEGDEAPVQRYKIALPLFQAHGWDILRRSDVVPLGKVEFFAQEEVVP